MASTSDQVSRLARDPGFVARIMSLANQYAVTVYNEDSGTPNHVIRSNFARSVLNGAGANIPIVIANSGNIIASTITYDFLDGTIKTDATDAAISSQIATYWNMLAGV